MQRLTIIRTPGDADELAAAKREHMDPVVAPKAAELGMLFQVTARGPDGLVVVNLWESEESSEAAARDPGIQRAREAMRDSGAATGAPVFEHYDLLDYRQGREN